VGYLVAAGRHGGFFLMLAAGAFVGAAEAAGMLKTRNGRLEDLAS
jgi:hypothetical protein